MSALFCLLLIGFIASSNSSPVQKATKANSEDYRLPEGVIGSSSIHYDLKLTLGSDLFETNTFTGNLELSFNISKDTQEIKLHASKSLTFIEVTLLDFGGNTITLTNVEFRPNSETEILTISASQTLEIGKSYILKFVYTAALITDEMYGLYKSSYKTKDGDDVYLATTQFQATYARRVFPCFDEPSFKATFEIKINHLSKYTALGNTVGTPVVNPNNSNFTTTSFATTPKMSTYLVAFVVSDFTCSNASSSPISVPHRICSRTDAAPTRKLAEDLGPQIVDALQNYTGVNYEQESITKIDQVAIPDFAAGAMENWGLATYRETALLWNETESSNRNKQRVVTVVAHELGHMWFGDLVTTHWWSDTFLNEGFATFFEYFAPNEVNETKSWELDKQFVIEQVQSMLQVDSLKSSRPLSWPAFTPSEVSARFGSVSYNKGGSIFRMVQHMMGTEKFKAGLQEYLKTNSFGNVKPTNLWTSLANSNADINLPSGKTLENVMQNWVELPGYPLLNVTTDGSNVVVSQQRFYTDGSPANETETWFVPITYTTSNDSNKFGDTSTKEWLIPGETLNISLNNASDWIILNNQQVGYYRIQYDDALWTKIVEALDKEDFDNITDLNRAQLVDDFYNLAKANITTHTEVLNFYKFLQQDTSYYTWYAAFTAFQTMLQRTGNELIREGLSKYILNLMESLLKELPFNDAKDDDQIDTLKKNLALTWACRVGQQNCIDSSIAAFKTYRETNVRPFKNLRSIIYCNALRNSKDVTADWSFLWQEFLTSELATEQTTILSALGCTTDRTLLTEYLEKSIDASSGIRQQDALSVFSSVYTNNPEGIDIAFDFLIANYLKISDYYGSMNSLSSLINGLSGRFTKQEQVDKLDQFLKNTDDLTESLLEAAKTALESAKVNIKLTEAFETEMRIYLKNSSPASVEVKITAFVTTLLIMTQKLLF